MRTILHTIDRAQIAPDPFPHVIADGVAETYPFPSADLIVDGRLLENNSVYRLPAARILGNPEVSREWQNFAQVHTSQAFFAEVVTLFGDTIRALHPELETRLGCRLEDARTSIRGYEPMADIALDCQLCWGSPVTTASSSNACHVDRPVALFAGLLYCRLPEDDAEGGDLELYRFRGTERRYDDGRFVDASLVEPVKRIPYAANRLVFFLHSPHSLHGVTVRQPTQWPRLHVNFLAETRFPIFELRNQGVILSREDGEGSAPSGAARDRYGSFAPLRMTPGENAGVIPSENAGVILSREDGEGSPAILRGDPSPSPGLRMTPRGSVV
ncbi:MAG: hypothetical protein JOZ54_18720 [Acidobacteria bacterium]|nr:hypothetical protein [Acidobacteriota bacterium]